MIFEHDWIYSELLFRVIYSELLNFDTVTYVIFLWSTELGASLYTHFWFHTHTQTKKDKRTAWVEPAGQFHNKSITTQKWQHLYRDDFSWPPRKCKLSINLRFVNCINISISVVIVGHSLVEVITLIILPMKPDTWLILGQIFFFPSYPTCIADAWFPLWNETWGKRRHAPGYPFPLIWV